MTNLKDKIIISTRPLSKDDKVKDYLTAKGAVYLDFPMIEILPANIDDKLTTVLKNINTFQWLIFTSKNGVEHFFNICSKVSCNVSFIKIAAIGKTTAEEIIKNNQKPYFVSKGNTSTDFLNELKHNNIQKGENVLLALGDLAKDVLETGLSEIANITRINVYKTVETENYSEEIIEKIKADNYSLIIFTSPSGFRNFKRIADVNGLSDNFRIACIGKTTEQEIINTGDKPLLVSPKSDGLSFAKEIEKYLISIYS